MAIWRLRGIQNKTIYPVTLTEPISSIAQAHDQIACGCRRKLPPSSELRMVGQLKKPYGSHQPDWVYVAAGSGVLWILLEAEKKTSFIGELGRRLMEHGQARC
jgi:hypothetical protein